MDTYRKLAKISTPFGLFTSAKQIWKAEDHFLISHQRSPFLEEYRRYYFKDIQYITVCKTKAGYIMYSVISLLLLLSLGGIVFFYIEKMEEGVIVFEIISAALFIILLFIIIFCGSSSKTVIKTIAGDDKEAFRGFYRKTLKVVKLMKEQITEAQGAMPVKEPIPPPQQETLPGNIGT